MSEENVEIAWRGYRAFNERGVAGLRPYLLDDVVWETPKSVPESGTHSGIDAVIAYVEGLREAFKEVRLEPSEILGVGQDEVLVALRVDALGHDDTAIEMLWWHLWKFRGGKVSEVRSFLRRDDALQAAGLSD